MSDAPTPPRRATRSQLKDANTSANMNHTRSLTPTTKDLKSPHTMIANTISPIKAPSRKLKDHNRMSVADERLIEESFAEESEALQSFQEPRGDQQQKQKGDQRQSHKGEERKAKSVDARKKSVVKSTRKRRESEENTVEEDVVDLDADVSVEIRRSSRESSPSRSSESSRRKRETKKRKVSPQLERLFEEKRKYFQQVDDFSLQVESLSTEEWRKRETVRINQTVLEVDLPKALSRQEYESYKKAVEGIVPPLSAEEFAGTTSPIKKPKTSSIQSDVDKKSDVAGEMHE